MEYDGDSIVVYTPRTDRTIYDGKGVAAAGRKEVHERGADGNGFFTVTVTELHCAIIYYV